MALDTASKRGSALLVGLPFRTLPIPDGTIGQGDRQQVALCYAGILAAAPVVENPLFVWTCQDSASVWTCQDSASVWTSTE